MVAPRALSLGEQNEPLGRMCLSQIIYQICSNFQPFLLPARSLSGTGESGLENAWDALPVTCSPLPTGARGLWG